MIVNIHYAREGDDWNDEEVELNHDDLKAFLACKGIGYNGKYYLIKTKIFEFTDKGKSLTVITEHDMSIIY